VPSKGHYVSSPSSAFDSFKSRVLNPSDSEPSVNRRKQFARLPRFALRALESGRTVMPRRKAGFETGKSSPDQRLDVDRPGPQRRNADRHRQRHETVDFCGGLTLAWFAITCIVHGNHGMTHAH
jgi:hypothetical protein